MRGVGRMLTSAFVLCAPNILDAWVLLSRQGGRRQSLGHRKVVQLIVAQKERSCRRLEGGCISRCENCGQANGEVFLTSEKIRLSQCLRQRHEPHTHEDIASKMEDVRVREELMCEVLVPQA